jgi:hypothetical protein
MNDRRQPLARDLTRSPTLRRLLWRLPLALFVVGFLLPGRWRLGLWPPSLGVMGIACLVNGRRCGRVHCVFTGPIYLAGALASLAYGLGLLPLGPGAWDGLGATVLVAALAARCIPEWIIGRYWQHDRPSGTGPGPD